MDNRVLVKEQIKGCMRQAWALRAQEDRHRRNRDWAVAHEAYYRRVVDLRKSARALQLAYAYMRGIPYRDVEPYSNEEPKWEVVKAHIRDGCVPYDGQEFGLWRSVPPGERASPSRPSPIRAHICGSLQPGVGCGEPTTGHFDFSGVVLCHRCAWKTGLFDETPNGYVRREVA